MSMFYGVTPRIRMSFPVDDSSEPSIEDLFEILNEGRETMEAVGEDRYGSVRLADGTLRYIKVTRSLRFISKEEYDSLGKGL